MMNSEQKHTDFSLYTFEEFLQNDFFISSMNYPTEETQKFWDEFEQMKAPESKRVFITDPALATAGSILKTLEHMKKYGFKDENVVIMAMFGCQSGIERIFKEHPEVKLFLVHMADGIREDGYLLPYNGDTGDRLYGVRENEYVI